MLVAEAIPYKNQKEKSKLVNRELRKNKYVEVGDKFIYSYLYNHGGEFMNNRYWENQSGVYDPVAKEVINNETNRNKEIHDTINQVKNMFKDKDLILVERMVIKDKLTKKIYR